MSAVGSSSGTGSVLFNMLFANFLLDVGKDALKPLPQKCASNTSVCYDIYGVEEEFSMLPPWANTTTRPIYSEPRSPEQLKTGFLLFTHQNQTQALIVDVSNMSSLYGGPMSGTGKVFVIVHGYKSSARVTWADDLRKALLRSSPKSEVLLVDWRNGAADNYIQVVANMRVVARQLAHVIHTMQRVVGIPSSNFHLIGHSVGAHLCGITGSYMQELYGVTLPRITGLDPAHPYHTHLELPPTLDDTDAIFVDVIHSDNTSILGFPMTVGMMHPIGHLNFYPNGGGNQPGCNTGSFKCHHARAIKYFTDSALQDCSFLSVRCPSYEQFLQGDCWGCSAPHQCSEMGLAAAPLNVSKDSMFFLLTRDQSPFCGLHYLVRIFVSNTTQALDHDGEFGILLLTMEGTARAAAPIRLSEASVYYRAGSVHKYVVLAPNVGTITRVRITFMFPGHFINPMSWRISQPRLYLNKLDIQMINSDKKSEFCFDSADQKSNLEYVLTVRDAC